MPSYSLELELFSVLNATTSDFEIWADGVQLGSGYSVSSSGTTISIPSISYGGSLPTSLEFRFDDAAPGSVDQIEIRAVIINDRYVNTGNYLSSSTLNDGGSSNVNITDADFIFDSSDPAASNFTPVTYALTAGNDTYRNYDGTVHVLDGLAGNDRIYLGSGADRVTGGAGNDRIFGGDGNDLLYGAGDNDKLEGQGGDDELYGGTGNDRIHGGTGDDEIHGGAGNDRLNGHDDNDVITGGAGDDYLHGGDGIDYLFGDGDDDQLVGGAGNDTLDGGAGDDLAYGNDGNDIIDGGLGADILIGNDGTDTINGGAGNDDIYGGNDADTLHGGDNDDDIYGGAGADIITGDDGNDTIYGDAGGLTAIMQAGTTSVTQANSTEWHSITFDAVISNPVIKLFGTDVDGDPFTLRVQNVTNRGFEFQLDEFDYQDGSTALEGISWMAVASGTHTLASGHVIQAGYVTASNETASGVTFGSAFGSTPVVFSQLSSNNEAQAAVTRNTSVTTTGFNVNMHEQESNAVGHASEDIGWIAIEAEGSVDLGIISGRTADVVTHATTNVSFGGSFTGNPVVLADMQVTDGADPSVTAGTNISSSGIDVFIDEEASLDAEVSHTTETVGYVALEDGVYTTAGRINASDTIYGGDGNDTIYADIYEDITVSDAAFLYPLSAEILGDGAVGYWRLNETSGTTMDNLGTVGSTIDGSSTGSPTLGAAGLYSTGNGSIDFDGTNDGILIPDHITINTGTYTEKTVELVFNADDVTTRQVLYEEGGATHGLTIYLDGGNVYVTGEEDGVWVDANISAAVSTGTTYHVAFVFDSAANSFEGFLDGVSMGSVTVGSSTFPSHSGDIGIGYAPDAVQFHDGEDTSGGYHFNGRISDVAVYTTALTGAQLSAHSDIVQGTLPAAEAIDDVIYGGDGLDTLYGGEGRDSFVFESASAFNDVDVINGFDVGENDAIDISDLLVGYTSGVSDINDFVQITESGGNTLIGVDANGTSGGSSYTDIVQINDIVGLDVDAMLANGSIIDV